MSQALKYFCIFALLFASKLHAQFLDNFLSVDIPIDISLGSPFDSPVDTPVEVTATSAVLSAQFPGEACNRVCVAGNRRICYYKFVLEHYQAMGVACRNCSRGVLTDCDHPQCVVGDGVEKGVMSINRQIPGPAIQVCKDDQIVVDVLNQAGGTAASIHWHGLHMLETPHMDGVPFVTQCPIPFGTTFRYNFRATEAGTQFYHSHAGHHKINGQYGALIVRVPPSDNSNINSYDFDQSNHYILISDWMHTYAEQVYPGLPRGGMFPNSLLINGRGSYVEPTTQVRTAAPPTRYYVRAGKRYRFRLINSVSHACSMQVQIQQHSLTIIASDSFNVEPSAYDTLICNAGERYDFVLNANHTQGDFWIRVRGLGACGTRSTEVLALLRYISTDTVTQTDVQRPLPTRPNYNATYVEGEVINHPNAVCFNDDQYHCVSELQSDEEDNQLRYAIPDHKFYLTFNNHVLPNAELFQPGTYDHFMNLQSNITLTWGINNMSTTLPSSPPLTQPLDIDESEYCDELNWPEKCQGKRVCQCVHRLRARLNSVVELVVIDGNPTAGTLHHPFHFHGHRLMVTNMGQNPAGGPLTMDLMQSLERQRRVKLSPFDSRPPFKDTVSIPSRGFITFRFRANNPGFWLMHCHYEWHMATGMALIVQVGDTNDMVLPPDNFPKCGNFLPAVRLP